ncbi:MAG: hypothetical protein JWO86_3463 [Myxococcaceae bacterium]|jgi:hypothetical protein|nr:hypothetical protein [Myxococcaceae bacterium]
MSLYHLTVPQFEKNLQNLERWFDKAADHAKARSFDVNTLLAARLAPDMMPLVRQIQVVCDNAKMAAARLTGKEAPSHPDTEKTFDELRTRIHAVLEYIRGYKPADFEGAEARLVTLPWMPGKVLTGKDYVSDFALANFFFHYTTAYDILRHNGVEVGKADFIGSLPFKDA